MLRVKYFNEHDGQFSALAENIRYDAELRTDVADLHVLMGSTPVDRLEGIPRWMPSALVGDSGPERYWFPADVNEEWDYYAGRAQDR